MSHITTMVDWAKNGSICAVSVSGIRTMSDSLIAFQPAIEEPSNITPSANMSSSTAITSIVTCCSLPLGSVKRRSTNFTSLSAICFMISAAVVISCFPVKNSFLLRQTSDSVDAGLAGADADNFLDVGDEDLAVTDAARLGGLADCVDRRFHVLIGQHDFDLHLR